jgi:hypothetical protein
VPVYPVNKNIQARRDAHSYPPRSRRGRTRPRPAPG